MFPFKWIRLSTNFNKSCPKCLEYWFKYMEQNYLTHKECYNSPIRKAKINVVGIFGFSLNLICCRLFLAGILNIDLGTDLISQLLFLFSPGPRVIISLGISTLHDMQTSPKTSFLVWFISKANLSVALHSRCLFCSMLLQQGFTQHWSAMRESISHTETAFRVG